MSIGEQLADISRSDVIASAAKVTPPVSVASLTLLGYPIADWVLLLTALYTGLQIWVLVRDKFLLRHRKH
ncbi:Phage holin T7 family, holin superfamily II [Paraburkholderia fungorum]|uniref:Phage holin T7 family, holin superfamily II n=2 Tax=Paraburkholderia fungorum TaxID=134537 RepID=A0A1H1IJH7_9BURK|nr:Phage holin T7 family, holin superfamily II [Paraburkholderia fungorum]